MNKETSVALMPSTSLIIQEAHKVVLDLAITAELPAFAGHFPDVPVLPGVVQLHWATELSREYFARSGDAQNVDALKFQNIIAPPVRLRLVLEQLDTHKVAFQYSVDDVQASSGRITFVGN